MRLMMAFQGAVREITDAHTAFLKAKQHGLETNHAMTASMLIVAKLISKERLLLQQRALLRNEKVGARLRAMIAVMLSAQCRLTQ